DFDELPGQQRGGIGIADLLEDDGEFVAAETGDQVLGTHAPAQPLGYDLQQPVAGGVAEAVVDVLEAVQVKEKQCQPPLVTFGPFQGMFQAGGEQQPVGQSGEDVVVGLAPEPLFRLLDAGDVGEQGDVVGPDRKS